MKVLIVSKAFVVGLYRQKLLELHRLGIDVAAVTPRIWHSSDGEQHLEPADDCGYRLISTDLCFNGHFHLHYYPQLSRVLRTEQPDLLHMDEEAYNLATYLGMRSARSLRVPSVFFTWQNINRRYPPPFAEMERSVYRSVSGAIAGTAAAADVLRAKGYQGRLAVIPQFGVDTTLFHPGDPPPRPFRFGFLNRLIPAKGPILAIEALSRLPADIMLDIVGDGPLRADIERAIAGHGLSSRVTIRPRIPSTHIPALMRSLHGLLLPSLTTPSWKEQFGRVLIEAMASGVPIVASDSGEIPDVVGDAGLIVPEADADALAAAMRRLYDDSVLRAELGGRGRARAMERFANPSIARQTLDFYREVLGTVG